MSSSTIPYCAVEERRRLNRCMEKASDDYEKEIYRKIRDMPVPYEKLDEILKDSRDIIISRQHRKNRIRNFLVCVGVFGFLLVVFASSFCALSFVAVYTLSPSFFTLFRSVCAAVPRSSG